MSMLSKFIKKTEKSISNVLPHVHSKEKRTQMQAAKEQIDYYKSAKEELGKEREANESMRKEERQKINEKELRSKQRNYRRYGGSGFMAGPENQPKETLG